MDHAFWSREGQASWRMRMKRGCGDEKLAIGTRGSGNILKSLACFVKNYRNQKLHPTCLESSLLHVFIARVRENLSFHPLFP